MKEFLPADTGSSFLLIFLYRIPPAREEFTISLQSALQSDNASPPPPLPRCQACSSCIKMVFRSGGNKRVQANIANCVSRTRHRSRPSSVGYKQFVKRPLSRAVLETECTSHGSAADPCRSLLLTSNAIPKVLANLGNYNNFLLFVEGARTRSTDFRFLIKFLFIFLIKQINKGRFVDRSLVLVAGRLDFLPFGRHATKLISPINHFTFVRSLLRARLIVQTDII